MKQVYDQISIVTARTVGLTSFGLLLSYQEIQVETDSYIEID
jgi:hypothetical protein